ncbi:fluoride efflux transporter CrcB [Subtercola frigoramans]|uniref:Fluoride-specific ion channel FluC n=1 Tax=Subtercola frigoramans TaxID=120298 RepID=A0ABS2L1A4_9MICO|nr:fluoride efflux transporter CrcB [Subtercola frigoramans]MBM7470847.1 CrcB protein [Subtercola frigoramans]
MTPLTFALLSLAGGLGAALRFWLDGFVKSRFTGAYPLGTTIINVSGSLILGLITGLTLGNLVPQEFFFILGTGLMGGYTTFSTASFETVRLVQQRRWAPALMNGVGMLVLSVLAALLGLTLGQAL